MNADNLGRYGFILYRDSTRAQMRQRLLSPGPFRVCYGSANLPRSQRVWTVNFNFTVVYYSVCYDSSRITVDFALGTRSCKASRIRSSASNSFRDGTWTLSPGTGIH